MILKLHKRVDKVIVAVCDSELLGKKFEEGKLQLDLTSNFYNGDEKEDLIIGDTIRNADSINLVGEKSIQLAIDEELIDESQVKKIAGIPYAQAILMH